MEYEEILKVKEKNKSSLLGESFGIESAGGKFTKVSNIVGVGIGRKITKGIVGELGIIVNVIEKLPKDKLRPENRFVTEEIIPESIDEVKTDVVETGVVSVPPTPIPVERLVDRTRRMRPALPGCSIGHYKITAGTFGCVVKDRNGEEFILSNNHVLANENDVEIGDPILQYGPYDGGKLPDDKIAELSRFIPLSFSKDKPNYVDCAIAKPINDQDIDSCIIEIGEPKKEIIKPELRMRVTKSGRTTGVTNGTITQTDVTVNVTYSKESAHFENQIIATPMSRGGDSGSLVLTDDNKPVGLLFAGSPFSTVISPIEEVLKSLDVEVK